MKAYRLFFKPDKAVPQFKRLRFEEVEDGVFSLVRPIDYMELSADVLARSRDRQPGPPGSRAGQGTACGFSCLDTGPTSAIGYSLAVA